MSELKIPENLYWQWRTTVEEKDHSQTKLEGEQAKLVLMQRELTIANLRIIEQKHRVQDAQITVANYIRECDKMKAKIEKEVEIPYKEYTIAEDYSVKDITGG